MSKIILTRVTYVDFDDLIPIAKVKVSQGNAHQLNLNDLTDLELVKSSEVIIYSHRTDKVLLKTRY